MTIVVMICDEGVHHESGDDDGDCHHGDDAPLPGLRLGQLGPAASPDPGVPLRAWQSSWATPAGVGGPSAKRGLGERLLTAAS